MVKMVLSDFASRKFTLWENKQGKMLSGVWGMVIVMWMLNFSVQLGVKTTALLAFYWGFLALQGVVHAIYPTSLSPAMYLAPLTKQEKLSYLYCCFWVKITAVSVLFSMGNLVLVLWGKIKWQNGIAIILSFVMISISMGLPTNRKSIDGESKLSDYLKENRNKWQEIVYIAVCWISYGILILINCEKINIWLEPVLIISFLTQLILFPWIIKNGRKKLIEGAGTDFQTWKSIRQKEGKSGENCN